MIKRLNILLFLGLPALAAMLSCNSDKEHPGYTFMPDMQFSRAYETYDANALFDDSMGTRMPPERTIPRGFMPFEFKGPENEYPDEFARASELVNPVELNDEVLANGKYNYSIYCAICHGDKGDGQGHLVKEAGFPTPTDYNAEILKPYTDGQFFYSIHFGKNMMGSYASQLSQKERWEIVHYIRTLQNYSAVKPQEMENANVTTGEILENSESQNLN